MIEFSKDNPLLPENQSAPAPRVRIVGIGHTGISAIDQIVMHGCTSHDLWALDTDDQAISGSVVPEKILLGEEVTYGLGCRGDSQLAAEIAAHSEGTLFKLASDIDCLVMVYGLGGATGRALGSALLRQAQIAKIKTIAVVTTPFSFEGETVREQAEASLAEIRAEADAALVYSSDRLRSLSASKGEMRQGFYMLHQAIAHSVETLSQILSGEGHTPLGFADVRSLFGRYTECEPIENCWAASVTIDADEGHNTLVSKLMAHPFLQPEVWKEGDRAMACLCGGSDMSLTKVQNIFGQLQKQMTENFPILTTTTTEEKMEGRLRLTLMVAKTRIVEPAAKPAPMERNNKKPVEQQKPAKKASVLLFNEEEIASPRQAQAPDITVIDKFNRQEELPLEPAHRGRFENSVETIYKGENLDQPTFRRRKIAIRL